MPAQDIATRHYLRPGVMTALFDRMAGLTSNPDATFAELSAAFAADPRLHVPDRVYNAVRNRAEPVLPGGDS